MTKNVFYNQTHIASFKHALSNNKVDMDYLKNLMEGYPAKFEDLSFSKQGSIQVASYNGRDLFSIIGNKVIDLKSKQVNTANLKAFNNLFHGPLTNEAVESFIAKQFFECQKGFVSAYLEFRNKPKPLFDAGSKVPSEILKRDLLADFTAPAFRA